VSAYVKARKTAGLQMAGFVLQATNRTTASAYFNSRIWPSAKPELVLLNR
jgi:hypothetical protein